MEIVAITKTGNYSGPVEFLVKISASEFNRLLGNDSCVLSRENQDKLKIGAKFNISNLWDHVLLLRRFYNEKRELTTALRLSCDDIDKIKLPSLETKNGKT